MGNHGHLRMIWGTWGQAKLVSGGPDQWSALFGEDSETIVVKKEAHLGGMAILSGHLFVEK